MAHTNSHIVVLGGPNGAGKSACAPGLLQGALQVPHFVNADVLARGLSGFAPENVAPMAARLMLRRLAELAERRESFAFESTLASRSLAPWLRTRRAEGFDVHVVFLWLPSAEIAVSRVQQRARRGGHDVPVGTVRRRYDRGKSNFFDLYQPLATTWRVYDNQVKPSRLIARGEGDRVTLIRDQATWAEVTNHAGPR